MKLFYDYHLEQEYIKLLVENTMLKDNLQKMEQTNLRLMELLEKVTDGNKTI